MVPRPLEPGVRALALAVVLITVALIPPSGAAHSNHLDVLSGTLAPLANQTYSIGFDDTPLVGGWVFILEAKVQGGNLGAVLSIPGHPPKTWTIPPGDSWYDTTVLPDNGFYDLTLTNPGAVDVTYLIYYDQSCTCFAKDFPDQTRGGILISNEYVIFDVDVNQPSTVAAEFYKPAALSVKITAAVLIANSVARWPGDFTALGVADTATPRQAGPGIPPVWMYDLSVTVSTATRLYYFVEALRVDHPENMTQ